MRMNKKDINDKNGNNSNRKYINRNKIFLSTIAILFIIIAILSVAISMNSPNEVTTYNNNTTTSNNNSNNISNNNSSSNEIGPKEGYSLVTLSKIKFYAKNEYLGSYFSGDYYECFIGDKDYDRILKEGDDFDIANLNRSQIYYSGDNGKIFKVEMYLSDKMDLFNYFGVDSRDDKKNITFEDIQIQGHTVTKVKTGNGYTSQAVGENETYVYFNLKGKSIILEFTGIPFDDYVIGSFFILN
jgi:uncharacterized protein YpmS